MRTRHFFLLLFLLFISATQIYSQTTSLDLDGFRFKFDGVVDNANGTSTWTYTITGIGASKDLSHWVLALCENHKVKDANPNGAEIGRDPRTQVYGIKWDRGINKNGGTATFSFTLEGYWQTEDIEVAYKAGTENYYGEIAGPTCEPKEDSPDPEPEDIRPILECVVNNGDGTLTAHFGYLNPNNYAVEVPVGPENKFSPSPENRNQPITFQPGRTDYWPNAAFTVTFNAGTNLVWTLNGRTSTASAGTQPCSEHIYFEKQWYDENGDLMDALPENLPEDYRIEVTSSLGTAVGEYNTDGELVFTYTNNSPALDNKGLWVPVNSEYTVEEFNLPEGYTSLAGVGTFEGSVPGGYASNPYSGFDKYGLHVIKNQKEEDGEKCVEDWSVTLDPDSAICEYEPQWITINGSVSLTPNPSRAKLQFTWRIVHPNNDDVDNSTHYSSVWIAGDTTFSISAYWPGITAEDTVVEIHYGVNVLDCNGNPLPGKNGVGRDLYWYPWVCDPPEETNVDIEVQKTASVQNPENGDEFTYTITAKNNGPGEASGVKVTDLLPDGLIYLGDSPSVGSYSSSTGIWNIGSLSNGSTATLQISVRAEGSEINNSTFDLGPAKNYNLFVLRDVNQPSSDTEGRMAVGRDATIDNYSVGDKLPTNSGDVLIVGRSLYFDGGRVYFGNAVYGDTVVLGVDASVDGELRKDSPIDFSAAKTYLENLSLILSNYSVNAIPNLEFSELFLTGTDPLLNTFDVSGEDLTAATNVVITAPNGSVVLVNISGNNIVWSGGLVVSGTSRANVLYNFYEAQDITIQSIDVLGSVLAPKADVNFTSGVQNGQMICKSLEGQGQFNNTQFLGNIPVEAEITNIAYLTSIQESDGDNSNNSSSFTITVNGIEDLGGGGSGGGEEPWEYVGNFAAGQMVWTMTEDSQGRLLAGTWGGNIYRSNEDGSAWELLNEGMGVGYVWDLQYAGDDLFAATEKGTFIYDGTTWNAIGLVDKDVRALNYYDGVLYAGVWGYGVYKSTNKAVTWEFISDGIPDNAGVHAIGVNSEGHLFAALMNYGMYRSTDFGHSWQKLNVGYEFFWSLEVTDGDVLLAGTYGDGLYQSNDNGESWVKANLNATHIYSISKDGDNNLFLSSWLGGVHRSTNGGQTWEDIGMGGYGVSSVLVSGNGSGAYKKSSDAITTVFAGTRDGSIYKKVNNITSVNDEEKIPTKFELYQNYPNPFNPTTTIQFDIPKAGNYKLTVFNILGQRVAELVNNQMQPGQYRINFDASRFATGVYLYQLIGDKFNTTKKMLLLK